MAHAIRCPCGDKICKAWMVSPQAAVQGVRFTQAEAEAVAKLLNKMNTPIPTDEDYLIWAKDKSITAILIGKRVMGDLGVGGRVYNDRRGRFEDGFQIYTSTMEKYDPVTRILTTKNSKYLLTDGQREDS